MNPAVEPVLHRYYNDLGRIDEPSMVVGGDVCETGERFFIGFSQRTNEDGAKTTCSPAQLLRLHFEFDRHPRCE